MILKGEISILMCILKHSEREVKARGNPERMYSKSCVGLEGS